MGITTNVTSLPNPLSPSLSNKDIFSLPTSELCFSQKANLRVDKKEAG